MTRRFHTLNSSKSDSECVKYGLKNYYACSKVSITRPIFTIIGLGRQRFVKNLYTEFHENPKDRLVIDRQADRMTDRCGPHTRLFFSPRKERVNCRRTIRVSNSESDSNYFCFSKCPKRLWGPTTLLVN